MTTDMSHTHTDYPQTTDSEWKSFRDYQKTIEYANDRIQITYNQHPSYSEKKIRNPFKVALKIYALVPDELEWKVNMKSDLDAIACRYGHFAPELWSEIWRALDMLLAKYYDNRFGNDLPTWAQQGLERFMRKEDDPDDYS